MAKQRVLVSYHHHGDQKAVEEFRKRFSEELEDIQACLLFASKSLQSNDFMPLVTKPE
jgi:uncharacterized protein YeaO (DUF488 family)